MNSVRDVLLSCQLYNPSVELEGVSVDLFHYLIVPTRTVRRRRQPMTPWFDSELSRCHALVHYVHTRT